MSVCGPKPDPKKIVPKKDVGIKHDQGKQNWYAMPLEILEPLADVFYAGEKEYELFNCMKEWEEPSRRFYDAMMRHARKSQMDPLAIDQDLKTKHGIEVYHLAQVAWNALLRLHNCKKEDRSKNDSTTTSSV